MFKFKSKLTIDFGGLELPAGNLLLEHVLDLGSGPEEISIDSGMQIRTNEMADLFRVSGK